MSEPPLEKIGEVLDISGHLGYPKPPGACIFSEEVEPLPPYPGIKNSLMRRILYDIALELRGKLSPESWGNGDDLLAIIAASKKRGLDHLYMQEPSVDEKLDICANCRGCGDVELGYPDYDANPTAS